MTSRTQVVSMPVDATAAQLLLAAQDSGHSRFPVQGEGRDDIVGGGARQAGARGAPSRP